MAEAIASVFTFVHASSEAFLPADGDMACSLCDLCENESARGLSARPGDFDEPESFMDDCEGDVSSFLPSGIEKLHFFDGVFCVCVEPVVGVDTFDEP